MTERAREGTQAGGVGKEEAGSQQSREPDAEAQSQDPEIMTWAEGRWLTDWATQALQYSLFFPKKVIYLFIYLFIYLAERERESVSTISTSREPDAGLIPGPCDHDLS